jgi:hypothetical protein
VWLIKGFVRSGDWSGCSGLGVSRERRVAEGRLWILERLLGSNVVENSKVDLLLQTLRKWVLGAGSICKLSRANRRFGLKRKVCRARDGMYIYVGMMRGCPQAALSSEEHRLSTC